MDARFNMLDNELAAKFGRRFTNAGLLIDQSSLPKSAQELFKLRASQINGCDFCTDMHSKEATAAGETAVRLNLVAAWREATVFTEAERAALALAEEGTRLADAQTGVSDETWAQVRRHYDDDQTAALICLVGLISAANRMNVIVQQPGGFLRARHVRQHVETFRVGTRPEPCSTRRVGPGDIGVWCRHKYDRGRQDCRVRRESPMSLCAWGIRQHPGQHGNP